MDANHSKVWTGLPSLASLDRSPCTACFHLAYSTTCVRPSHITLPLGNSTQRHLQPFGGLPVRSHPDQAVLQMTTIELRPSKIHFMSACG